MQSDEMGKIIVKYRKEKKLTQNQLAEKMGISFQAVSGWERSETMPDIEKIMELTDILGISVDTLFGKVNHDNLMKQFNENKMYTYLKGYSSNRNMQETRKALAFAREMHKNQLRNEGTPYIIHPLTMACNLIALGISNDDVIATVLLHDVCEDCGVSIDELPVNDAVKKAVEAVTFVVLKGETKKDAKKRYYDHILTNEVATITKLADRSHNVSSMALAFSKERLRDYIVETREYVLPLLKKAKGRYPDLSNALFVLKYHICSVVDSIDSVMNLYENDLENGSWVTKKEPYR